MHCMRVLFKIVWKIKLRNKLHPFYCELDTASKLPSLPAALLCEFPLVSPPPPAPPRPKLYSQEEGLEFRGKGDKLINTCLSWLCGIKEFSSRNWQFFFGAISSFVCLFILLFLHIHWVISIFFYLKPAVFGQNTYNLQETCSIVVMS